MNNDSIVNSWFFDFAFWWYSSPWRIYSLLCWWIVKNWFFA